MAVFFMKASVIDFIIKIKSMNIKTQYINNITYYIYCTNPKTIRKKRL